MALGCANKRSRLAVTVNLMWFAWASGPSFRARVCHFTTSYQATMSGTAYRIHGKPAVGWTERRVGRVRARKIQVTRHTGARVPCVPV